jgi:hypothetical protein
VVEDTTVQEYLTTTASPGRITRPVPSTMVVLDTPDAAAAAAVVEDDADDDEDDELSAAVDQSIVDVIANAARQGCCLLRLFETLLLHAGITREEEDC